MSAQGGAGQCASRAGVAAGAAGGVRNALKRGTGEKFSLEANSSQL